MMRKGRYNFHKKAGAFEASFLDNFFQQLEISSLSLATVAFWSAPSAPQKNTVILRVRRYSNSSGKGDGHDEAHSVRAPGFSVRRKHGL